MKPTKDVWKRMIRFPKDIWGGITPLYRILIVLTNKGPGPPTPT